MALLSPEALVTWSLALTKPAPFIFAYNFMYSVLTCYKQNFLDVVHKTSEKVKLRLGLSVKTKQKNYGHYLTRSIKLFRYADIHVLIVKTFSCFWNVAKYILLILECAAVHNFSEPAKNAGTWDLQRFHWRWTRYSKHRSRIEFTVSRGLS